ncbi:exopolysaccharide transport family protein [Hoeflea poritis]|uniref:Wzz/FepE/Etk N-terminal domain-containing protein n=1 Tax=Hoeflea poritis TaxID=2993659 RepID=A0ABT4VQ85_9HYPH|nr:Wzz/FepE/Etk N-terminal domain-containing protein [Hoeflea poritis]MDA4846856.1 Wzz/FepE/Etk N-terminal domain-containing protein [Hoeflea poritis]
MSRPQSNGNDVDIDIARLFSAVWKRRVAIVSLILIVCAAAFVISGMAAPRYSAESRILIEAREPLFVQAGQQETGQAQFLDERGITSQVEIINSTNLIKSVADQLDLADKSEFSGAVKPSMITSILIGAGLKSDPYDAPPEERLIETFRSHLNVYQVANSRVIVVAFWSTDRKLAAQVANAMAETYLSMQSGAKLLSNADATAWLEPEIANLREKVRVAEAKVADYRAQSGLLLVDDTATLATQQLAEISTELSRVRGEKAEALARATAVRNAINSGRPTEDFANVVQSEVIQRLRERQAAVQAEIADLSVALLDAHPRIKGLRSQLRDIDKQVRAETRNILRGFENEAEVAQLREEELVGQLNDLKADSARAGSEEVELRALEREATAQRELLEVYLSRYREAASRSDRGNLPADARIISEALVPTEAYFPKPVPITIIAGLVTLLLASITIMMHELFSGRALRPVDYGEADRTPVRPEPVAEPGIAAEAAPFTAADRIARATERRIPDGPADDLPGADLSNEAAFDTGEAGEPEADREMIDVALEDGIDPQDRIDDAGPDDPVEPVDPVVHEFRAGSEAPRLEEASGNTIAAIDPAMDEGDGALRAANDEYVEGHELIVDREVEHSVSAITGHLIAAHTNIAVVVSPEGDKGSTTSVMLARMLANEGRQTLLVDMTGSACPSRMMVPQTNLPGITEVLVDACTIPEALHADRLSNAHILPQGGVDPAQAMRHADHLPEVIAQVSKVYDIVVIECGPANSAGVRRLLDGLDVDMIFSVVQPEEDLMTEYLSDFYSQGFNELLMMSPGAGTPNPSDRSAA